MEAVAAVGVAQLARCFWGDRGPLLLLYEDLNCPFCYALTTALHAAHLDQHITWRGIEHVADAPTPWASPGAALAAMISSEVDTVRTRCPGLPIKVPRGQPNTHLATLAVTDAFESDPAVGHRLKGNIKHALFVENRDISSPAFIDAARASCGLPPLVVTPRMSEKLSCWQKEWEQKQPRMIPMLVPGVGPPRLGLGTPEEAVEFVREHVGA